jgi:hypothetical protein
MTSVEPLAPVGRGPGAASELAFRIDSPASPAAGAYLAWPLATEAEAPSALDLRTLAHQFADGLSQGFVAGDVDRLAALVAADGGPGPPAASPGELSLALVHVQARVGLAEAFMSVGAKLAEGLQTLVVRGG